MLETHYLKNVSKTCLMKRDLPRSLANMAGECGKDERISSKAFAESTARFDFNGRHHAYRENPSRTHKMYL